MPKGAGLRQGSSILNIDILCDFNNVNIHLALSVARLKDRLHRTFPSLPTPPLTIPQELAEFNSATEAHLYTRELNCDIVNAQ